MIQARRIVQALTEAGFQAYMVGGAVRDLLLGSTHTDIDICTSALPQDIISIAQKNGWKTEEVGAAFGSIMVIVEGRPYDVTTFRREEYGQDSHKPSKVEFGVSLESDLARRDFTINTLCLDGKGDILDIYGGLQDLRLGIIRAVGDPNVRFAEDGLRMFRAARFAAQFGFTLDKAVMPAITDNLSRVRGLSVERVRNELEKTLLSRYASRGLQILQSTGLLAEECRSKKNGQYEHVAILPELQHLVGLRQNPQYHHLDAWRHVLCTVDIIPSTLVLRWAALLHDIGKGLAKVRNYRADGQPTDHGHDKVGAELAAQILTRLKADSQVTERVGWLIRNHMHGPQPNYMAVVKWLRRRAKEFRSPEQFQQAIRQLFELYRADGMATRHHLHDGFCEMERFVEAALLSLPFYPEQLAIGGREFASYIGAGPQVRKMQNHFLERIQTGELVNTKNILQDALQSYYKRHKRPVGDTNQQ